MTVLVCGGRHYDDRDCVFSVLDNLRPAVTLLVAGGQTGADTLAVQWARTRRVGFNEFPVSHAEWKLYGPSAGPRRNARMLERAIERGVAMVIAFPGGRGTADMCKQAKAKGVPVFGARMEQL